MLGVILLDCLIVNGAMIRIVVLGVILLNVIIVKGAKIRIVALGVIMPGFLMPSVVIVNGVGLCIIIVLSVVMFSGRSRPRTGDRRSDRR